jgi:tetratricopeptide (TPR) repeat protein
VLPGESSELPPPPKLSGEPTDIDDGTRPGLKEPLPYESPQIQGYELISRLGSGGMGTVWKAVQTSTHREVALKLMGASAFGSERARVRFDREVELMARLEHPNIARVYDSGTDRGLYYYAMELVEGLPLDDYVAKNALDRKQILELMKLVCQAIQFAHQRGVIHRDLKPSNIVVTRDGQPHVLDFGLAKSAFESKVVAAAAAITIEGEIAGTPAYMSPEQAEGKPVDTRSDVYSLGVILYRLLTGESPHDLSGSHLQVMQRIAKEDARRPRHVDPTIDRELDAVLHKALKKEPAQRYESAGEMAHDIENYLTGEPLIAKAPTTVYFLRKRIRKHWMPFCIAAGIVLAFVGLAVWSYVRINRERAVALVERARAESERGRAEEARGQAEIERGLAQAARDRAEVERNRAVAATDFLSKMLVSADPGKGNRADIRVRDVLDSASKQIEGLKQQPDVEAVVRSAIGHTYTVLGIYPQAEEHVRRAMELNAKLIGENAPVTLGNRKDLGAILLYTARYKEAEPVMLDTLNRRLKALGENNFETADSIYNLGLLYMLTGKHDEAVSYFKRALAIREKLFGTNSAEAAACMQYLAMTYAQTGHPRDAEDQYKKSLAIRKEKLGAKHFEVGNSLNNLAMFYINNNRGDLAEPLLVEALDVFKVALPPDHPNVASTLENLVAIRLNRNDPEAAAPLEEQAIKIKEKTLPPEHPELARSLGLQAGIEQMRGHPATAEALYRRAAAAMEKAAGPDDINTIWMTAGVGLCLKDQEKFTDALPLIRKAHDAYVRTKREVQALDIGNQLVEALIQAKQFAEAEPLALTQHEQCAKVTDPALRAALSINATQLLINLYDDWGKPQKAAPYRVELTSLKAATQPSTAPAAQPATMQTKPG